MGVRPGWSHFLLRGGLGHDDGRWREGEGVTICVFWWHHLCMTPYALLLRWQEIKAIFPKSPFSLIINIRLRNTGVITRFILILNQSSTFTPISHSGSLSQWQNMGWEGHHIRPNQVFKIQLRWPLIGSGQAVSGDKYSWICSWQLYVQYLNL